MPAATPAFFMQRSTHPCGGVEDSGQVMRLPTPHRSVTRRWFACGLFAFSAWAVEAGAQQSPTEFRVIPLSAGIHVIRAEVAMEPSERAKGLMHRDVLGVNQGMVFLFDQPAVQCMWMRNTLLPLSVAFIADDGRILNIEDMAPKTEDNHCAAKPARYALEMNQGWFRKHGIVAGAKISGLPRAAP